MKRAPSPELWLMNEMREASEASRFWDRFRHIRLVCGADTAGTSSSEAGSLGCCWTTWPFHEIGTWTLIQFR